MTKQLPIFGSPRGSIPFSPQGWIFIIPTAALMLIAWAMGSFMASALLALLLLFILNFFRDPERTVPQEDGLFICPADGKVIRAEMTDRGHQRVDIFMNVFNVHVNRAPMAGRISRIEYTPGRFVNASFDHASDENERNRIEMMCGDGIGIAFTQISGLLARRIVSYVKEGDCVEAGQRVGMIRFGSRVNCEIPADYALNVKVGEHVTAGATVIARKHGEKGAD